MFGASKAADLRAPDSGTSVSASQSVTVLFVDPQPTELEKLIATVGCEPGIDVVGATTPPNAVTLALRLRPEVVVLGLAPPHVEQMQTVRHLKERLAGVAVVIIAVAPDDALTAQTLQIGCSALIPKGGGVRELVATVRIAAAGGLMFPPKAMRRLVSRAYGQSILTDREIEVLGLIAAGQSTHCIADRLGLSSHTIRNHVKHLFVKLGVHSRLEAVLKAKNMGLVDLAPERQRPFVPGSDLL